MKRLALASVVVFVIGLLAAIIAVTDRDNAIIDSFTFISKNGVHYFFTIRTGKTRKTVEVTEAVYNSHGYGDTFDSSWVKDGYQSLNVKPMGSDQDCKPR